MNGAPSGALVAVRVRPGRSAGPAWLMLVFAAVALGGLAIARAVSGEATAASPRTHALAPAHKASELARLGLRAQATLCDRSLRAWYSAGGEIRFLASGGATAAREGGLSVRDASGRVLPARMTVRGAGWW
jgi:hypothetical protein